VGGNVLPSPANVRFHGNLNANDETRRRKKRLIFIGFAWAIAVIAAFPHPAGIVWFWAFPAGLSMFFTGTRADLLDVVIGWPVYIALTAWAVSARRRWLYIAVYVLICVVLALNVVGCRRVLRGLDDLH
jgi:hypothetical protein